MDPVGGVVELPVGVAVALLQRIPGPHAQLNGDDVGLGVREVIARAREVHGLAIRGEDVASHVVAGAHGRQRVGIGLQKRAELCVAVGAWSIIDGGDRQVVDHPSLVPPALVVDHEQPRDVREYVDERAHVVGIGRQARLGLQDHAHRANGGQAAVGSGRSEHRRVVDAGYQARERVRLEAGRVQQEILKELARLGLEGWLVEMRFGVGLRRELAVRAPRQLNEPIPERPWQMANVAPVANGGHVHVGGAIRVAGRRRLLCPGQGDQGEHGERQHCSANCVLHLSSSDSSVRLAGREIDSRNLQARTLACRRSAPRSEARGRSPASDGTRILVG